MVKKILPIKRKVSDLKRPSAGNSKEFIFRYEGSNVVKSLLNKSRIRSKLICF